MNREVAHDDERETDAAIFALVWAALRKSRYAVRPREWDRICVVVEAPADPIVELRAALSERLRGAGLDEIAHQVAAMNVPDGSIMLFASFDDETSGVGLEVVRLVDRRPTSGRRRR